MEIPPSSPSSESRSFWQNVRDALKGTHRDYTEGPVGSAVVLLAVPMVLEMVLESVFAVVDVFFVGRLGSDAVAAVGITESLLTLIYTVAMGLGIGATAVVARRIGEKDSEGAAVAAAQTLSFGVALAVGLGVLCAWLSPQLLSLMGATPEVIRVGLPYARVMLGSNIVIIALFLVNAVFRGAGDGTMAMRSLWLANALNIVLCPCFIFGVGFFPELGLTGAAVATTIGRGLGAAYAFFQLVKGKGRVRVILRHFRWEPGVLRAVLGLSLTATLQVLIGMASWIGLVRIIALFGSQALAGYTIGIRVITFALLPSWGLGNAAATMVGQALGAGKPERAERAVWIAAMYNMYFLSSLGGMLVLFAPFIVGLFTAEPEVSAVAVSCLRIVGLGFPFYAYGMVLEQSFNGAGDTWTPTRINFLVFWLWEIPMAYVLSVHFGMGPRGTFVAIVLAFSTLAMVSAFLFRRGHWKTRRV